MQEKVFKMEQGSLSRVQNQIALLHNEVQNIVQHMKPQLQKMASEYDVNEDQYQQFIKKLKPSQYYLQENHFNF